MSRSRGLGIVLVCALAFAPSLVHAKKKKKDAGGEGEGGAPKGDFQPEAAPTGDEPSKTLDRALKLYDTDDFFSASIELNKVVEGESGDSEANKQKAEFWMGKALYSLKFYSASLSYFDRIVQKGPSHAYYNATLKWLASLSRQLPDSTGILEKIGKFNYQKGQFKEAVELFAAVPPGSEWYVESKLFEGATHVREYEAKPAVDAFKEVLRASAESSDPKIKPFEDLANLSLARTFYSTGQFDLATKYFDRVSQESYDWANSLFEASWANFMLKQKGYSKALGNIHTLQAPFFENYIKPESIGEALTVKATIYFYNCLYDRAEGAISEFNSIYPQLFQDLSKLVATNTDNAALFELAVKIRQGTSGLPEGTERAARAVLSDKSLVKRFEYVDELTREINQHDKADTSWKNTNIAQTILADLTLQKSLAMNEGGDLSRRRIKRLTDELAQLIKRVIKIEYEILQGAKGDLEQEVQEEQQIIKEAGAQKRPEDIRADDEHDMWPFTGEYWRDELGYYRVKILNKCAKSAPEGAPSTEGGVAAPVEGAAAPEPPAK